MELHIIDAFSILINGEFFYCGRVVAVMKNTSADQTVYRFATGKPSGKYIWGNNIQCEDLTGNDKWNNLYRCKTFIREKRNGKIL